MRWNTRAGAWSAGPAGIPSAFKGGGPGRGPVGAFLTAAAPPFKDLFISYGRRESLGFVGRLHQRLKLLGYDAWFDKVNIPDGDDYVRRIDNGIESAHNFVYVMAPRGMTSVYCLLELEYAALLGKRIIPVNHAAPKEVPDGELPAGEQAVMADFYRRHRLEAPVPRTCQDVLIRTRALLGKTDWLYARETLSDDDLRRLHAWQGPYENSWARHDGPDYLRTFEFPVFGQSVDPLDDVVERMAAVIEREKDYVARHTDILGQALIWDRNGRFTHDLLVGPERQAAEEWLLTPFVPPRTPPCRASDLHCDFICASRKNAEHMMTDAFICSAPEDSAARDDVIRTLSRRAVTVWSADRDIEAADDPAGAAEEGIVQASKCLFLMSPGSAASADCGRELDRAAALGKPMIPLLVAPLPTDEIPEAVAGMETIDFTDISDPQDQARRMDALFRILDQDREYHERHKILLTRALRWRAEDRKSSFLLRGHNLENAQTWLRLNAERERHPPLDLHRELIAASEAARGQLSTEVFICYSRKDGDFARRLNTALQAAGKTTWFDQESIGSGADFEKEIFKGISGADNVVFIISPDATASPYCEREVDHARAQGKRFIPLLHRRADPDAMPAALRAIEWIDFVDQTFDKAFAELIQTIELDREHAHAHTRWQQRAGEWRDQQRHQDFLLNASACAAAETWLRAALAENKSPAPTDLQQAYIRDSRAAVDAAERAVIRRRRRTITALSVGLIIAVLLALFAFRQMKVAEKQTRRAKTLLGNSYWKNGADAEKNGYRDRAAHYFAWTAANLPADAPGRDDAVFKARLLTRNVFPVKMVTPDATVDRARLSRDRILTWGEDGVARLWDAGGGLIAAMPHDGVIDAALFSPDGRCVFTATEDGAARLWDAADGRRISSLPHAGQIWQVALSENGGRILTYSGTASVRLWDGRDGKAVADLDLPDGVFGMHMAPDGRRFLTWGEDKTLRMWDGASGGLLQEMVHKADLNGAVFSPDGERILTWDDDNSLALWSCADGSHFRWKAHDRMINGAAFSADGARIVSWGLDDAARVWDAADGGLISQMDHGDAVDHAAFSKDGRQVLSCASSRGQSGEARLWDADAGELIIRMTHRDPFAWARFSEDERVVIARTSRLHGGGEDVLLWDAEDGRLLAAMEFDQGLLCAGLVSEDARILAWGADGVVRIWARADGQYAARIDIAPDIDAATLSLDGRRLLTRNGEDNAANLWDMADGRRIARMPHDDWVAGVVFSADEQQVLTWGYDQAARLWNAADGALVVTLNHEGDVYGACLSPNETRAMTWGEGGARVWDAADGRLIARLADDPEDETGDETGGALFSRSGKYILTWTRNGGVRVWKTADFSIAARMAHDFSVKGGAFSADESRILTWSDDNTARLWRSDGGPVSRMEHEGTVNGARFSRDETRILTWSLDRTAGLWNAADGARILRLEHDVNVNGAIFSSDGEKILSWSGEPQMEDGFDAAFRGEPESLKGAVRLWNVSDGSLIAAVNHESQVIEAAFSGDERRVLSLSDDGVARLWRAADGVELLRLHHANGACFDADEAVIVTWNRAGAVRRYAMAVDADFPVDRLPLLMEVLTGSTMDDYGNVRTLRPDEWTARRAEYASVAEQHLKECRFPKANPYPVQRQAWAASHE